MSIPAETGSSDKCASRLDARAEWDNDEATNLNQFRDEFHCVVNEFHARCSPTLRPADPAGDDEVGADANDSSHTAEGANERRKKMNEHLVGLLHKVTQEAEDAVSQAAVWSEQARQTQTANTRLTNRVTMLETRLATENDESANLLKEIMTSHESRTRNMLQLWARHSKGAGMRQMVLFIARRHCQELRHPVHRWRSAMLRSGYLDLQTVHGYHEAAVGSLEADLEAAGECLVEREERIALLESRLDLVAKNEADKRKGGESEARGLQAQLDAARGEIAALVEWEAGVEARQSRRLVEAAEVMRELRRRGREEGELLQRKLEASTEENAALREMSRGEVGVVESKLLDALKRLSEAQEQQPPPPPPPQRGGGTAGPSPLRPVYPGPSPLLRPTSPRPAAGSPRSSPLRSLRSPSAILSPATTITTTAAAAVKASPAGCIEEMEERLNRLNAGLSALAEDTTRSRNHPPPPLLAPTTPPLLARRLEVPRSSVIAPTARALRAELYLRGDRDGGEVLASVGGSFSPCTPPLGTPPSPVHALPYAPPFSPGLTPPRSPPALPLLGLPPPPALSPSALAVTPSSRSVPKGASERMQRLREERARERAGEEGEGLAQWRAGQSQ